MSDIKLELHQMIDQIADEKILEAVYTLLSNQTMYNAESGEHLDQSTFEILIEEGEKELNNQNVFSQEEVKEYFNNKLNG